MFKSKVAIVTGSSTGIGAGTAIKFAKEGAAGVVLHGRQEEALKKVREDCEKAGNGITKIHVVVGDITDENTRERLIKETIEKFGRLDILVNNAGVMHNPLSSLSSSDAPIEIFDKMFNVNVRSLVLITQLAIPYLVQSKGNIVNVSSIAAIRSRPPFTYYNMSKIALDHFTRCLAVELGPKGVRVNGINPGFIGETELSTRHGQGVSIEQVKAFAQQAVASYPLRRGGTVEEVANLITFLASDKAGFITGDNVVIDGGVTLT